MNGREDKKSNDLFFTCSLIGYIARKTKNTPAHVVNCIGKEVFEKIYELADIYHSDNIESVSDDFIEKGNITCGTFDNVSDCNYSVPSYWDIGKVYKRLILMVAKNKNIGVIDALIEVYNSHISELIEDYNSSFYFENPETIFSTYQNNCIPE